MADDALAPIVSMTSTAMVLALRINTSWSSKVEGDQLLTRLKSPTSRFFAQPFI